MPTFIGFNTINQYKKFTLTDFDLVKRDLLNALSIRQGELVGRPEYGCSIWNLMFENQLPETVQAVQLEIERVIGLDPRLAARSIDVYPQENGILVEVSISVVPNTNAELLQVFFDRQNSTVAYIN